MVSEHPRLPIKVVGHRPSDFRKPASTGGSKKIFGEVTASTRRALTKALDQVERAFEQDFTNDPDVPAVARVILRDDALAKSHRPSNLFSRRSCPIIGAEGLGELLVSVRPKGLSTLRERISGDDSKQALAAISTVQAIEPYRVDHQRSEQIAKARAALSSGTTKLRLRLFQHGDTISDDAVHRAFVRRAGGATIDQPPYGSPGIFRLRDINSQALERLSAFVGTQSICLFPKYHPVRVTSTRLREAQANDIPAPDAGASYPIVGLIDSGVDRASRLLKPWIHAREDYVPDGLDDCDHGTFVAGLLVHGRALNGDPAFPIAPCRIVDVAAIPRDGSLSEDELLIIIEEVAKKYAGRVRIWNLSLGTSEKCDDAQITEFAAALDRIQDRYGVLFVVAAGNISDLPLRTWPPSVPLGEHDRIVAPADSTRGLTVGARTHIARPLALSPPGAPSPFSLRGPGYAFIPKPDLSHIGGNCTVDGSYTQMGVCSLVGNDMLAEDIGTSFAAPLVASVVANVDVKLKERPSNALLKALTVHSAVLGAPPLDASALRYTGFGTPGSVDHVLSCVQDAATLVFEVPLRSGIEFEKLNFPIPACLRDGDLVRGEFIMTLVYDPPLDDRQGTEYCRSNVDASLGTYTPGQEARDHSKKIPEEPRNIGELYERHLVEHGFKWSPVKVYRRLISRGVEGRDWRLLLTVHHRAGYEPEDDQVAALIVTIRDPKGGDVYDDVVRAMRQAGWITQDLAIQGRLQSRP